MVMPRTAREWADATSVRLYGWTPQEARDASQCVRCRKGVGMMDGWSARDRSEWAFFSALCPECWDYVTDDGGIEA